MNLADLLTAREFEVAVLVAQGLTNREIAERLGISALTVRTHMSAIGKKLPGKSTVPARRRILIIHNDPRIPGGSPLSYKGPLGR